MKNFKIFFIGYIVIPGLVLGYGIAHPVNSPVLVDSVKASDVLEATSSATIKEVHYEPVEEYIRLTFGVYADKAMLLLKGDGHTMCGGSLARENSTLDPKAVFDNTTYGGKGRDRGIFQISSYYHPQITDEMAFDYKTNIDYAWRMFKNDNYTFKRWTAGRCLGI